MDLFGKSSLPKESVEQYHGRAANLIDFIAKFFPATIIIFEFLSTL